MAIEPRPEVHPGGTGDRANDHQHDEIVSPHSLAPHECGQQDEQQHALGVWERGPHERRGHDRERNQRQRGAGSPQIAEHRGREGQQRRRVEQQNPSPEQDHLPDRVVDAGVGNVDPRQRAEPLADRVGGHRHAHVHDPAHRDPAHE